jgi:hypothetical protein
MSATLSVKATEKSTYIVTATFTDEDDNAVAPNTLTWTLADIDGTVINSREDVSVASPASSESIVLSGDDLQIVDSTNKTEDRIFTINATYDSSNGTNLPLKESVIFTISNLKSVS